MYCFSLSLTIFESLNKRPTNYTTSFQGHLFDNIEPDWSIPYIPVTSVEIKTILRKSKNCVNWQHEGF